MELKRSCVSMLTGQQFESFGSIEPYMNSDTQPSINFDRAFTQGKDIQFFENAFEWTELIYVLYPYFWGRKSTWIEKLNMTGNDPDHVDFLQSGEARVNVPVRPGY